MRVSVNAAADREGYAGDYDFSGLVHSVGTEKLGFSGRSVLDNDPNNPVPQTVITLLNTPVTSDIYYLSVNP